MTYGKIRIGAEVSHQKPLVDDEGSRDTQHDLKHN